MKVLIDVLQAIGLVTFAVAIWFVLPFVIAIITVVLCLIVTYLIISDHRKNKDN